jgi:hypothetical protein
MEEKVTRFGDNVLMISEMEHSVPDRLTRLLQRTGKLRFPAAEQQSRVGRR